MCVREVSFSPPAQLGCHSGGGQRCGVLIWGYGQGGGTGGRRLWASQPHLKGNPGGCRPARNGGGGKAGRMPPEVRVIRAGRRGWQLLPPGIWGHQGPNMDGAVQAPFKELALEATRVSRNATFYVWSPLCLWITHPATLAQKGRRWGAARIPGVPPGSLDKLPSGLGPGFLIWDILYFALPASDAG